jgi:glycosyltransferase involved in cell wall biosynthesis
MPQVSVLMPTFNNASYIEKAIESILDQTYKDFELIIINDASTDDTENILKTFSDNRIVIINNDTNLGLIKSLNIGLNRARGIYISRMDGDDICRKDRLQLQVDFLQKNDNIGVCGTWAKTFGNVKHLFKHPISSDEIKSEMFFNSSLIHATMLIRRDLFSKINDQYPNELHAEDFSLFNILKDYTEFANIPDFLYFYRVHDESVSQQFSKIQKESTKQVYSVLLNKFEIKANTRQLNLHYDLSKGYIKIYNKRIFSAINWLFILKNRNKKFKIYNIDVFNKVIYKYLKMLISI